MSDDRDAHRAGRRRVYRRNPCGRHRQPEGAQGHGRHRSEPARCGASCRAGARRRAFASLAEAVAAQAVDRVHVMVPPHLHAAVGGEALNAGLPTLLEKPLGVTLAEANALVALAAGKGVALGVNQNFALHPALARFARDLKAGLYGRLRHVSLVCAVPLRQLTARQFGHWMFASPRNILLEQMVHPLSQIAHLLEGVAVTAAVARSAEELAPGYPSTARSMCRCAPGRRRRNCTWRSARTSRSGT
ncbi:Gfo/Idh/MocA family oxidoreductase [Hankyongella ginsenosidimutans]|uniref:Gfo/Idh/MocA family oxidoreductase n=1 Tax=Hankyongella ginsenosidimutans TaxID=1763828 RepID=A0A4D7CBW1_9SPHN|nr:Gfo/Idh/MocA family oxidoreductase [Hankyongella ginsenosidimutans]QCI79252.1 Gfo/Idh/MocA family oxidoreductase [Hankyongella ginsenosidimutans]